MSYIQPKTDFKDGDILYGIDLNASNEVIKAGVDDNFDRIQGLETGKQDTLTAGTGIEITEDNVINNTQTSAEWGNIQGDITDQTDLVDALEAKQDVIDSSHKLDYDLLSNTPTIPSKTSDLTNDNNTVIDASYVHTDNNYSDTDKGKLAGIETGAEENIIETIKVDSTALTPDANKAVNIDLSGKIDEPTTEGTNGQVLTTDGNGGRTWTTVQGGGGTSDYTDLTNKPQINNVTLSGNKSLSDLGIDIPTKTSDLNNDSGYITNTDYATSSTGGVIRVGGNSVSINNDGKLMADVRTYSNYQSAGNSIFIGKGTLENVITGKELVSSSSLATVATSGSYSDLSNKPTIPTKLSDLTNDNDTVTDASYVHTDNNYTTAEKNKLGSIEAGAKDNVINLYAVSATAPSGGTLLSIYYNTTDHKFYQKQLTLGIVWVELPNMTPKYGIIYVTSEPKATYVYDGTTLVCIGSNDLVMINEDATENTKLVIEEEDLDFQGLEISDEYTTGDNVAYSCDYVNENFGELIWTNIGFTSMGAKNVAGDFSNYSSFKIAYFVDSNASYILTKTGAKGTNINLTYSTNYSRQIAISDSTITIGDGYYNSAANNNAIIPAFIIGYK